MAIGIAAVLGSTPALAADLPLSPDPLADFPLVAAPPPVLIFRWTGCYLGIHFGGAIADNALNGQFQVATIPATGSFEITSSGVLGGGQVGCDLQFAPNWVIGAQADAAGANVRGSSAINASPFSATGTLTSKTDFYATATGRIGYAAGQGLFYLKGGAAWTQNDYTFSGINVTTSTLFSSTGSESRVGWTVGAGTEWVIAGNWSIFGEYNFMDFGSQSVTFADPAFGSTNVNVRQYVNELKLGINYRFGSSLRPGY